MTTTSHTEAHAAGIRHRLSASVGPWNFATIDVALVPVAMVLGFVMVTTGGVKPPGSTAAGIGMVLVVLPLLARKPAPVAGLIALLAADLVNIAAFGQHTRCGVILSITAYLVFTACRRAAGGNDLVVPIALATAIGAVTLGFELGAAPTPIVVLILGGAIMVARIVRRRDLVIADLAHQSRALDAQREQSARLAVEAERARIGGDLGVGVEGHVATLLEHAKPGAEPTVAAFTAIEEQGRAGLSHMRAVLDDLHPAVGPQPSLDDLDALLAAGRERATLRFDGERRTLAPGIELAACRIVELLLGVIDPTDAGVQVRVQYNQDAVEVELTAGVSRKQPDPGVLAAAQERAAAVGGSVAVRAQGARTHARVLLPATMRA